VHATNVLVQSRHIHRSRSRGQRRMLNVMREGDWLAGNLLERLALFESLSFLRAEGCKLSCNKGLRVVVVVVPGTLVAAETDRAVPGDALLCVVGLRGGNETLAAAAGQVNHKRGHHEARECTADFLVEVDNLAERGPEVFHALHHIALVDVVLCVVSNDEDATLTVQVGEIVLTGSMLIFASVLMSSDKVSGSLLTPLSSTAWLRTITPCSNR
jgi:hypothetical protein